KGFRQECRPAGRSAGRLPAATPAPGRCRAGPAGAGSLEALPSALPLLEAGWQRYVLAQAWPEAPVVVEGDLPALHARGLDAGLAGPVAQQLVIVLAVDQVQVEGGAAGLQLTGPLAAGRAVGADEQGQAIEHRAVQRRRGALDRQQAWIHALPRLVIGALVGQFALGAGGFQAHLQFGVALAFGIVAGFHAQRGERIEAGAPVAARAALDLFEAGPFLLGQTPGLGGFTAALLQGEPRAVESLGFSRLGMRAADQQAQQYQEDDGHAQHLRAGPGSGRADRGRRRRRPGARGAAVSR